MKKYMFVALCGLMSFLSCLAEPSIVWRAEDVLAKTSEVKVGTTVNINISIKEVVRLCGLRDEDTNGVDSVEISFGHKRNFSDAVFEKGDVVAKGNLDQLFSFAWTPQESGFYRICVRMVGQGEVLGQLIRAYRIWHVDANKGDDANSGKADDTPFKTIQKAINASSACDEIWVADGRYEPISTYGMPITIKSINGAEKTVIDGGGDNRCATLLDEKSEEVTGAGRTRLIGVCLENGFCGSAECGAGVIGGVLENCVIRNCHSGSAGGGAYGTILCSCIISNCVSKFVGGGAASGSLTNCLIVGNRAQFEGGGVNGALICNCTVADNSIPGFDFLDWYGYIGNMGCMAGVGGWSTIVNSIVWNNYFDLDDTGSGLTGKYYEQDELAYGYSPGQLESVLNSCLPLDGSLISIFADPEFVDPENGDYRIESFSPCVDAGDDAAIDSVLDLAGKSRRVGAHVDMGAYEVQSTEVIATSRVEFDLGGGGQRVGGGDLVQDVVNGRRAIPPTVHANEDCVFLGWDRELAKVRSDTVYHAVYANTAAGTVQLDEQTINAVSLDPSKVYVVYGDIRIPAGVHVEIPVGTIIKFFSQSSLSVLDGASCSVNGAIFTHIADDTIGGDTLLDGDLTRPIQDAYAVVGLKSDDTTEFRYLTPESVTVSGHMVKNETWKGNQVYHVEGNLTIDKGVTLAILPGAVVKFGEGGSLCVIGTLNVMGTRAQPVVFTSINDRENGICLDLPEVEAHDGDWIGVDIYGMAMLTYCEAYYGAPNNESGIFSVFGGLLDMRNCIVAHARYDGIWNWGGRIKAQNCIVHDCGNAVCPYQGQTEFWNCVLAYCNSGFMDWSHWVGGTFKNCIFYGCGHGWCDTDNGPEFYSHSAVKNCCFYNPEGYSKRSCTKDGIDGCLYADPRFSNPAYPDEKGWCIDMGSPCVDAGDGSVATVKDYYGQTRQTVNAATAKGTKAANGNYPDIGIYEVMPGDVMADVDLTVTSVSSPATMVVGDEVTVSWKVKNVGAAYATGSWRDKAEIVCANGTAVELGEKTVSASLAPGAEQSFSAKWTVPSAQTGSVRIRVTANAERDIFEGTLVANNACFATDETELSLPQCDIPADGSSARISVSTKDGVAYALGTDFAAGGFLVMRTAGKVVVRTGNGQMPTADTYYGAPVKVADDTWLVSVPEGGQAYLAIENEGETTADVEIAFQEGAFALYDTGETVTYTKGYGNDFVLTVYGNGFAGGGRGATALPGGMTVALVGAGNVIDATEVTVSGNGTVANVTFAESSCLAGDYHLRLAKSGQTIVQEGNPIAIKDRATGILPKPAEMEYSLEMLSTVRQGREYMGYIIYGNKGKGVGTAPYLRVTASNGSQVRFSQSDAWSTELELMGISQTYPASQVKAGESVKVPFYYMTSGTSAEVKLGVATAADGDFPWETNGRYMRPSWASDEFWELAFAILKANVGTTWGDWIKRMRHNSDYMMKLGKPTYRLEPLWQLEVNEALGVDHAVSTLAGGTDLARSGRGMGLSLRRSYGAAFYSRFKKGLFGYGWSDNYSVWAELQDSGATLAIHSGDGSTYRFYKTNGAWAPEDARDKTKVNETSDEYVLTYRSGTVQRIGKANMRVTSIADNQGNAIAFAYGGGRGATALPVRVEHTDGQALEFTYDGDKLVSVTDDQERTVSYAYDGDLLVAVTAFNGLVTRYSYYPADGTPTSRALRQIVYPDGNTKDFTYDAAGRVATSAVNGNLMMTEIVRSEFGSYKTIAPNGGVSSVSVGAAGEVLETVNALGQKVTRTYTDDTLLESMIGPTGKRSKIAYDADGNAVKATDAAGASTTFAYTSDFGSLAKVTDARGNSFNYGYDKLGRSEQIGYADNSMERIEYSDRGDITNSVNRRGQSVAYTYDREGNVLSEVWETGRTLTWEYDAKGNCTKATDSETGAVTMEYDANERLTRIAYPNGHGFTYAYDALGRVTARTSFDGFAQKYEYDALGRIAKLTDGDGKLFLENVYDETTGQLWLMKYGNGTIVSNSYDILGRTIGIYHYMTGADRSARGADRLAAFFEYAYDAEGRRISQTTAEGVERYTYDTVGQLTDVTYPDGTEEHFRYDAVGNRLSANGDAYEVNNLNQYTSVRSARGADPTPSAPVGSAPRADRTSFEYDLDGNMTKRIDSTGTTEYFYDLQNRLVAVSNETADIRWACVYDVFGNRVKVIDHGTVTEKVFVQGSLPSVAEEYSGATLKKRKIGMGSTAYAAIEGGNVSYSHEDGRMSTCVVSDADGKVKSVCAVKAFGEARVGDAHNFVDMLGVEYDDATGLYFMRNRYYDAGLGRFVQVDPIGSCGGINLKAYCRNDPIGSIDPTGFDGYCLNFTIKFIKGGGGSLCIGFDDEKPFRFLIGGSLSWGTGYGGGVSVSKPGMRRGFDYGIYGNGQVIIGAQVSESLKYHTVDASTVVGPSIDFSGGGYVSYYAAPFDAFIEGCNKLGNLIPTPSPAYYTPTGQYGEPVTPPLDGNSPGINGFDFRFY